MFNWVCPRCGRDVPPSKTECPFCAPPVTEPTAPPPQQFQPPPPPQYAQQAPPQYPQQPAAPPPLYAAPQQYAQQPQQQYPPAPPQYGQPQPPQYPPQQYQPQPQYAPPQQYPPQQYAQQPPQYWQPEQTPPPAPQPDFVPQQYAQQPSPQYAPPHYTQPVPPPPPVEIASTHAPHAQPPAEHAHWPAEKKPGMPLWMIGVLTAVGFLAVFGVLYYMTQGSRGGSADKGGDGAASASKQATSPNQKYVEVNGVRIMTQKGASVARFIVVSHSGVELTDVTATVNLWANTKRSEEDSVGSFTFSLPSLGAGESKELTAPFKSKMAPSDLPDWQNITADVQMTTPQ